MATNSARLAFDQKLHQTLPNPLAAAYRKAFNSSAPKDLHDNACLFGLGLMWFAAFIGLALFRELRPTLTPEETGLLAKLDRPSEGDWLAWLMRSVARICDAKPAPDSLGALLDGFWRQRFDAATSEVPAAVETLLQHLEKKVVVRRHAEPPDYFLTLVRYRNDTIGHGAGLPDDKNQAHGEAILLAASELAATLPLADAWELKYVVGSSLGPTSVQCQLIGLTGPQWMREPAISYPRGYPAPLTQHAVLISKRTGDHLDLHPFVVFHNERVAVFNGLRGKAPSYLEYDTGQKLTIETLAADYQSWKHDFGSVAGAATSAATAGANEATSGVAPTAVAARFRFDRLLGRGGMGEVWLAYDNTLKRPVAIKRVRPELLGRGEAERRFLQEARDAARLNHPNIVPILSIDSDEQGSFLVLEYMDGGNLRQFLERGPLPLPLALAFLRQILQALVHANGQGLVHRDVKPENILLTKAGVPKLADFGLAWLLAEAEGVNDEQAPDDSQFTDGDEPRVAKPGEGTRAYLVAELRDGSATPSPQSDLYALGITFYEMLTARPAQPISEKRVPSPAAALLQKLTRPDPNLRYPSAQAAADDCVELERALELAGRTREETTARIRRTAEQAYQLLAEGRTTDAQAGWERILAEEPDNAQAQCGLLLIQLAAGDMEPAAKRYPRPASGCDDPVFQRLRAFFEAIPAPSVLCLTPHPLPLSYRIDDLRGGRLSKELIELAADTVNLGDAGELLIELCQSRPGAGWECSRCDSEQVELRFNLPGVRVQADFRFRTKRATWLTGPRLLAADLSLTVAAEPLEIYRLARYLGSQLSGRYKRPLSDWVRPAAGEQFGHDAAAARRQWEQLCGRILPQILATPGSPASAANNLHTPTGLLIIRPVSS